MSLWPQRDYGVLCVSQFTLFGRLKGAGKPNYDKAMPPQQVRQQGHAALQLWGAGQDAPTPVHALPPAPSSAPPFC